jgi:hypothetical protein
MPANSQQQQQSQIASKQAVQSPADTESQELTLCPNCGAELPAEAIFCSECSVPVKQHICPKCGKANRFATDICESCKTWLLENQCKFCYAELDDGSSFCPECGSPKDGIPCPHCGNLSIFDFCLKCGKPVSERAIAEAQVAQAELPTPAPVEAETAAIEAEIAKLDMLINTEPVVDEPAIEDDYDDVYDPDDYYEEPEIEDEPEIVEEEPVRKSLFSDSQISSIRQTGADIDDARNQRAEQARIAEERRIEAERQAELRRQEAARLAAEKKEAARQAAEAQRIAAEQRQKAAAAQRAAEDAERQWQVQAAQAQKEALQKKLEQDRLAVAAQKTNSLAQAKQNAAQNKSKRFATHQDARCFHNARRHPDAIGWLCNFSDTVHLYNPDGGPNDCGDASKGGCDYFGPIRRNQYNLWEPDV